MKQLFSSLFLAVFGIGFVAFGAQAAEYYAVDVRVETPDETITSTTVYISTDGCTVTDAAGIEHEIVGATALCALHQASVQGNFIYELQDSSFGLYLSGINDYSGAADRFWLYYVDYLSASVGMDSFEITEDGHELLFSYTNGAVAPAMISANTLHRSVGRPVRVNVGYYDVDYTTGDSRFVTSQGTTVSIGERQLTTDIFGRAVFIPQEAGTYTIQVTSADGIRSQQLQLYVYDRPKKIQHIGRSGRKKLVKRGVQYLKYEFAAGNMTDWSTREWSAMAIAAAHKKDKELFAAVRDYRPSVPKGATASDLARHVMALEALGNNSRNFRGVNYVKRMKNTREGEQFGDASLCIDDTFVALALLSADEKYSSNDLHDAVAHSLNCVADDGSASYAVGASVDMDTTAALLMLLGRLEKHQDVLRIEIDDVLARMNYFVRHEQLPDGGWGYAPAATANSSTTAWMLMAQQAQGHEARWMTQNNNNGFSYLDAVTRTSGAVAYNSVFSESVEVLNTAYSILALKVQPFPVNTYKRKK